MLCLPDKFKLANPGQPAHVLCMMNKMNLSAGAVAEADPVFTASAADFQQTILMASMQRPILAYFTAAWCGPCKQLRPTIEKVVRAYGGKVGLAVIDIDANPDLAQAMRVQSVPQVYAFIAGQPVDGFMGAVPESQVKTFIAKLLAMTGQESDEGEENSADPFAQAMNDWSDGNIPAAIMAFKELQNDAAQKAHAEKAVKFLQDLLPHAAPGALEKARAAAGTAAESQHVLAMAALAQGQFEMALDALLASIKAERKWNAERARTDFVTLSEILGLEDERVVAARRKLSSILFS